MKLIKLRIKNRYYEEVVNDDYSVKAFVLNNITYQEEMDLLEKGKEFFDELCDIIVTEDVKKNIYCIETSIRGYDTYDSAVFCATSTNYEY